VGYSNFSRNFAVPATTGAGSYDLTWSLLDLSNNVLSTRTTKNLIWVNVTGNFTNLTLSSQSMVSSTITLQNGVVNRAIGRFVIQNDTSQPVQAILRMRVKAHGTSTYVRDLASENLISAPLGASTWTRPFAIPRYFATGSYDVSFELGTPDFTGAYDSNVVNNAFTITNPSTVGNVGIPILMYHSVNVTPLGNNSVSLVHFTQQMDYLANNGWHTITGEDIYNYIYKGTPLPSQPIWLTFDDSYQNNYDYVYPVLSQRGLRASIFTNTQYMGQMNSWDICCEPQHLHMTWNMLTQMRNANLAADSHTQHHVHFFDLNAAQAQAEVWGTQRDLVSFLGDAGLNFSYPYGQYPDQAEWAISHSGFHSAVIIGQVKQYTNFANMFELTRIGISDGDTLQQFINKITAP
jgi:peptidoglycan/xylan/chitin deacetylase (PgdA/CDA1 family)